MSYNSISIIGNNNNINSSTINKIIANNKQSLNINDNSYSNNKNELDDLNKTNNNNISIQNINNTNCINNINNQGFSNRDLNVQKEELDKKIFFKVVSNDNTDNNLILLTSLKNIISKQLPKMPKEYIVRLVFDRKHESLVLVKDQYKVIGGVCYRTNLKEKFIEIAFLAISHTEQVKGYGTRIMNKLKDHCREKGINYFLTYADNNAIGYFKKQGFSNYIKCPIDLWKDLIKDYDGGTLMEAYVNPNIKYGLLSENIKSQKQFIVDNIKPFLNVKHERKMEDLETLIKKYKNEIHKNDDKSKSTNIVSERLFNLIPGIKESRWNYIKDYIPFTERQIKKDFISQCFSLVNKLKEDKLSEPFLLPVNKDIVSDYYEIVKEPMDFQTLESNLNLGEYKNKQQFAKDLKKIFINARLYNKPITFFYKSSKDLESKADAELSLIDDY